MKNKKFYKENKGITLVALVITIIILIILASVSLSLLFSENGLINKAKEGTSKFEDESIREQINLAVLNASTGLDLKLNENILKSELDRKIGEGKYTYTIDEQTGEVTVVYNEKEYKIGTNGLGEESNTIELNIDSELKNLLQEANIELTMEDVVRTPVFSNIFGLIPTLTSADVTRSVDSGEIIYTISEDRGIIKTPNENSDSIYAWQAFDNNTETVACSAEGYAKDWYIEYDFHQNKYIFNTKYIFNNGSASEGTRKIVFQGYNESSNQWENIADEITWQGTHNDGSERMANISYTNSYKKIRVYVNDATYTSAIWGGQCSLVKEIQYYGLDTLENWKENVNTKLTNNSIEKITLEHMVTNKEFTEKLINKLSINTVTNNATLMANLPSLTEKITSDIVTKSVNDGVVTYNINGNKGYIRGIDEYPDAGYELWRAFDGRRDTTVYSAAGKAKNWYLEYEFPTSVYLIKVKYVFNNGSQNEGTRKFVFQGYDELTNTWEDLCNEITWVGNNSTNREDLANLDYSKMYKRYRVYINDSTYTSHSAGGEHSGFNEIYLYGKK